MTPPLEHMNLDETWTLARCAALLGAVQPGQELAFYAADHPSVSDPGAYIRVQCHGQILLRQAANHGWSSDWLRVDVLTLAGELHRNRSQQPRGVSLAPFSRRATEDRR
ncbi:hypothetical protein [Deinococcus arenicola]|uniref:Uncharacterized protein n=1 Tax=Deinococcus arenicola TaxID=2994950 RepID=A0ABU4DPU4_9DEIO|nr:hypothetical protein [Deinococcus sp. ZS9-10]MDV6374442.1 hypothetical protein [Deinococcus sp. ZS9-10]